MNEMTFFDLDENTRMSWAGSDTGRCFLRYLETCERDLIMLIGRYHRESDAYNMISTLSGKLDAIQELMPLFRPRPTVTVTEDDTFVDNARRGSRGLL